MRRAEVEHIKATLSRTTDRARLVWDRATTERPRQNIFVGTTNDNQYLKDTTGNRRFWPIAVTGFNPDALRRDRDQLWAEAAVREAQGDSIRLKQNLWGDAAQEQDERVISDPYYDRLQHHLGAYEHAKISCESLRIILDDGGNWTQDKNGRMTKAMNQLGWKRPNSGGTLWLEGRLVVGWAIGDDDERTLLTAYKDRDTGMIVVDPQPPKEGDSGIPLGP